MQFEPGLRPLLDAQEVVRIVEQAAEVLHEVGVLCEHERTQAVLRERTRSEVRAGRVHFDAAEVLDQLAARRAAAPPAPRPAFRLGGQWNCLNYCEPITGAVRPAGEAETIAAARLAEALGGGGGPIPLSPAYVPPRLRTLECERIGLLHTADRGGILTATDRREIEYLRDMNLAAGRRYRLAIEGMISPLRLNPETLNVYFDNADDAGLDIVAVTPIPMAGATAPLVLPAGIVQGTAESLGWDFVLHHISDGRLSGLSLRLEAFDMRDANIAIGTPEWCLLRQAIAPVLCHTQRVAAPAGMFRSNSRQPDAQAQVQRTASALWQAMLGARAFGAVGQLCMDEVFSPIQAIYDREILGYLQRLFDGPSALWDGGAEPTGVIGEGVEAGSFLGVASTLARHREAYRHSEIFRASNLGAWRAAGSRTTEALAWESAQSVTAKHQPELPAAARAEVQAIYDRAVAALS